MQTASSSFTATINNYYEIQSTLDLEISDQKLFSLEHIEQPKYHFIEYNQITRVNSYSNNELTDDIDDNRESHAAKKIKQDDTELPTRNTELPTRNTEDTNQIKLWEIFSISDTILFENIIKKHGFTNNILLMSADEYRIKSRRMTVRTDRDIIKNARKLYKEKQKHKNQKIKAKKQEVMEMQKTEINALKQKIKKLETLVHVINLCVKKNFNNTIEHEKYKSEMGFYMENLDHTH